MLLSNYQTLVIERSKAENDVEKCRRSIEETSHFLGLDVELDKVFACEYIKANFGRLPKEVERLIYENILMYFSMHQGR